MSGIVKIGVEHYRDVVLEQDGNRVVMYPHQARQLGKILMRLADGIEEQPGYVPPEEQGECDETI